MPEVREIHVDQMEADLDLRDWSIRIRRDGDDVCLSWIEAQELAVWLSHLETCSRLRIGQEGELARSFT